MQENYSAGVKHYDQEEYVLAIESLERALRGYYTADVECRVMCEGPQRFEEYEYLEYKADLYEAIAGEVSNQSPCPFKTQDMYVPWLLGCF